MSDIETIYHDLEKALDEFFEPSTTNQRKQEIDQALKSFQKDSRSIPYSLSFLEHSNHQYVLMYSLHILQTAVETLWLQLEIETKKQIKDVLNRIISQFFHSQPPFLSNKLLKVFALVGRMEWPAAFPNFFDQIFIYISDNSNQLLGLKMLQVTVEEFQNVADCMLLSFDQKENLKSNLKHEMEKIFDALLRLVENLKLFYRSVLKDSLSENFFDSVRRYCAHSSNIPSIPVEVHLICSNVLNCLCVIYQTVDLSFVLKAPQLLDFVFGICFTGIRSTSTSSETDILALNCVIELAGRNYPSSFHVEHLKLFEFLYFVIRELNTLQDGAGHDLKSKLACLNEVWLKKFVELIRLFFVHHIHRYDSSDQWPSVDLLQQFLTLTENFSSLDLFMESLEVWNIFLDYLHAKLDCKNDDERSKSLQYESLFEIAVSVLLNKMHVSNNSSLFDAVEVEFGQEFETSEWGQYIIACCDVLAKVADFHPLTVFHALKSSFDAKLSAYLNVTDPSKMVSINFNEMIIFFQDFQSVLKGLGRLSHLFINENFWKFNGEARDLVEKLCQAVVFSSRIKLYLIDENVIGKRLKEESTNLFAQFLLSVRSYCHWLAQFYADAQRTGENNEIISAIITSNVDCIVPLLNLSNPPVLISAAVSTLYSILTTVRPQMYLLNMDSVRLLYDEANKLTFLRFRPEIYKVLYGSLVNYLILPWYNAVDMEQEWSVRKPLYQKLMKVLLSDYINFCNLDSQSQIVEILTNKNCIEVTIPIVLEMLDSITNENSTTKKFCYSALKPVASGTLRLLQGFGDRPEILEKLLSLIFSMFATLVVQLGSDFTKETVHVLLQMTSAQNLVELLKSETSSTCKVLELILKILHCIVKEMAKSYQQFTPSVIQLLLENIKPVILQTTSVDLKTIFYEVLHSVLFIKWRYFFPVSILASMENQSLGDKTEHVEELLALFQTFGESLLNSEPSIIKQNLAYLNNLNVKWNLYRRAVFAKNLYPNFAQALLVMLVNRTHSILNEDFSETLAQMTCCCDESLNLFRSQLLERFLCSLDDLKADQKNELMHKFQLEKDVPSFTLSLQKFCNDIITFKMSNGC